MSPEEAKDFGLIDHIVPRPADDATGFLTKRSRIRQRCPRAGRDAGAHQSERDVTSFARSSVRMLPLHELFHEFLGRGRHVERCTFCEKRRHHVASLIAGPPGVYICNECIEICNSILQEEQRRNPDAARAAELGRPGSPATDRLPTPIELARRLDEYVVGQNRAKKVLSVAVYNHYNRLRAAPERERHRAAANGERRSRPADPEGRRRDRGEVQRPPGRPHRVGQDPPGAHPRAHAGRARSRWPTPRR